MSFNDPIAELLTRMRNAMQAEHRYADVSISKMKINILKILKDKGYIENFLVNDKYKKVRIFFKYTANRKPVIHQLQRISTPGLRRYVEYRKIPHIKNGFGMALLSTSKGIMDDATAREHKVGGELLCYVW